MSQAHPTQPDHQPERSIPLSEIPATIRGLRESWAQAYSRAEQLERENAELKARVDSMLARDLRNIDDLTELYSQHMDKLGEAQSQLAAEKKATYNALVRGDRFMLHAADLKKRLDAWIDDALTNLDRDTIADIAAGSCGITCPECDGDGHVETFDDEMNGSFHTARDYVVACGHCGGTGRALR